MSIVSILFENAPPTGVWANMNHYDIVTVFYSLEQFVCEEKAFLMHHFKQILEIS